MGYFSTGTEGMDYQERYCFHCQHFRDLGDGRGYGCPIWDLHLAYNYPQCDKAEPGPTIKAMLAELIPPAPPYMNGPCAMRLTRAEVRPC